MVRARSSRLKMFVWGVGKIVSPACKVISKVAPIGGAIIGSVVPGIGTAAGAATGLGISTGAKVVGSLFD